jgi:hypothetical protein
VCHDFNQLIDSLRLLQFRLELRDAGYVESGNPRNIDIGEKLSVLRTHMSRLRNHSPSSVDLLDLDDNLYPGCNPVFSGGVLSSWSLHSSSSRLDLVQLPSLNKGTQLKSWYISEQKFDVVKHWMDPASDLLVLLDIKTYGEDES